MHWSRSSPATATGSKTSSPARPTRRNVSKRPHVRFDGHSLAEISNQRWAHAQNDALGYFLWLYSRLARNRDVALDEPARLHAGALPAVFRGDPVLAGRDSGHWEEARKISASSIGTVVAGLEALLLVDDGRARGVAA